MSNGRILVVEDDFDISNMLRIFFTGQGYQVEVAARGNDALDQCRKQLPDLIVLDIMLPDMDGYTVCRELRTTTRTSHIPIIFLTQRDERSDRIAGLELGADDYITKPFDIEELKLRVRTAIRTHQRLNMTDPKTGLPSGRLIEDQLRGLMRSGDWSLVLVGIDHMGPFNDEYGFVAGDEVLRFTAMILNEIVDAKGTLDDFIGHASNDTFIIITKAPNVSEMVDVLRERFSEGVQSHYNFIHREQGGIELADGTISPLMRLSIGVVSDKTQRFTDIREITETAAELRRLDQTTS
ncbi:MAG: response regulator [Ardenticatenaceae bacterium]|nr:response regulator [Anaerolineales bacterium]MCB8922087.1 response regulator [Ardenticatenaceae bacterium]MCB9003203.1 response regulator [Ardenticatenaceae bacterium]